MRIAFFSPMPPAKSGIADYSAALLDYLVLVAEVIVFSGDDSKKFDPSRFDVCLYQIGNNSHHAFAYEEALRTPGVVVMHESNLHHLIADITIKRNDWDSYMREVEHAGGTSALAYAQRVRALEVGPDYEGVPRLRGRREVSRGVIAHSHCVEGEVRRAGFTGPAAVIPHGAWIPEADRQGYRQRLGVDPSTPLIGIFGFLKPYKGIAERLRAFRRLLRVHPGAKMILVGEPHPDFPLESMVHSLGLGASVRVLGFTPIEDFVGYIAATDIILNLRFPTVGESSGTLLRSLGLGKAVLVSDIGSFAEYPDEVCLKVPVDSTEEETLYEYLNLLVCRTDLRKRLGEQARDWVAQECNWDLVARRYVEFLQTVIDGTKWVQPPRKAISSPMQPAPVEHEHVPEPYIMGWATQDEGAKENIETHMTRRARTLHITPAHAPRA